MVADVIAPCGDVLQVLRVLLNPLLVNNPDKTSSVTYRLILTPISFK